MEIKPDPEKDKHLLKTGGNAAIAGTLSAIHPALGIAWGLSAALYGSALELRKNRAFEWVEMIKNNPEVFRSELINSEEFQDAFVLSLEEYIRLRSATKRRVAQKIFLDFAGSPRQSDYPLERYYDTLQKISPAALWLLSFIQFTIMPMRERAVIEKMKTENLGTEKPYDWWLERKLEMESYSAHIDKWLYDRYNPNSSALIAKYGEDGEVKQPMLGKLFDIEREQRQKYFAPVSELQYLGLVNSTVTGGGIGAGVGMEWSLTNFAKDFIKFITKGEIPKPSNLDTTKL